MYKVIIVEDEEPIRKGLECAIPWTELDCTVVGGGRNGLEGIRAIEELEPDIVIVDINMPIMDGVEMMKQTHEAHPYSAIVLSGYSSFDYAKDAMKYGAIRYLLKPLKKDELCEAIAEAKTQCERRRMWASKQSAQQSLQNFSIDLELPGSGIPDPVVSAMLDYAAAHYQEKVALQDVANALNYSIAFLNKRFKKQTGTTFIEYLNRYRIQKALELMKNGKVSRGRLGILMQQLTPELAKSFNLKDAKGALIAQIEKDGPADKAGLRDGDIVIEYNGKPIADIRELSQAVASTKPGAKVKVKAMREGKPVNLVIVVGEMPTDGKLNFKKPAASQNNALGANVRPLNDKEKKRVSNGLFVESVYGAAAEAGMRRGDIIISAGGKKIRTEKDLNEVVSKAKGSLAVLVDRNGSREFIPVKLSDEAKK